MMTITINNFNNSTLTPITFTDTWLPAASMSVAGAPSTTCPFNAGGALTNTANSVTITNAFLAAAPSPGPGATSCTITVPVTATATITNTIANQTFGGVAATGGSSTLTVSTITGSKSFLAPIVQTGTTTMTITLVNNAPSVRTITSVIDNIATMGAGFTVPAGAVAGGTCGSVFSPTSPLPATVTSVTLAGGTIPANGSCTITMPVAIAATAASGNHTNTIAVNGVVTNLGQQHDHDHRRGRTSPAP